MVHDILGDAVQDVMPALGTHDPMADWQLERMYPTFLRQRFVFTIGGMTWSLLVRCLLNLCLDATDGLWTRPWPAQLNRLLWEGGHDPTASIGQVVPHEVIGMANYNKNIFVGTGGSIGSTKAISSGLPTGWKGRLDERIRLYAVFSIKPSISSSHYRWFMLTVIGETMTASWLSVVCSSEMIRSVLSEPVSCRYRLISPSWMNSLKPSLLP